MWSRGKARDHIKGLPIADDSGGARYVTCIERENRKTIIKVNVKPVVMNDFDRMASQLFSCLPLHSARTSIVKTCSTFDHGMTSRFLRSSPEILLEVFV